MTAVIIRNAVLPKGTSHTTRMRLLEAWLVLWLAGALVLGAPVNTKKNPEPEEREESDLPEGMLSYDKYLREVVAVLEEDEAFQQRLRDANVSEIKSGAIARHLDFVNHNVRSKLDEIKRREIERLQELVRLRMKSMEGTQVLNYLAIHGGVEHLELPAHLDLNNAHSFEVKDLERLIKKTTEDMEELDRKRREEFKEYEMEKDYERKKHLEELPEEERKKEQEKFEEMQKKHKDHPKLNHPGSKDQLEEVWEKQDHLEDQAFNPKTFFALHDKNGDGFWSEEEVEAIMQIELDKVYDPNNPEDDMNERSEEMNRMREHIFKEIDTNHDKEISREEFLNYTGPAGTNPEFEKDEGWKTLDEEMPYTDEEYQEFLRQYHNQPGLVNPPMYDPNVAAMHQGGQGGYPSMAPGNLQYQPGHPQQGQGYPQQGQGYPQQGQGYPQQGQGYPQQGHMDPQMAAQMAQQHAAMMQQHQQQQQQFLQQQQQQFQQQPPQQQQQQQFQQQPPQQQQQQFQQPPQQQQQQFQQPPQPPQGQQQQQPQQGQLPPQGQQQQQQPQQGQQPPQQQQQQQVPVQGQAAAGAQVPQGSQPHVQVNP